MRKEVRIAIESKETSIQLEPVTNSYVTVMHQPVLNACSQMYVQKHSLAQLQDLIPSLAGVVASIFYTSQSRDQILQMY